MRYNSRRNLGFSLVELVVVIAIIVVLLAIVVPVTQRFRQMGWRTVCASNLHQISLLIRSYADDNGGEIPAVYGADMPSPRPMGWYRPVVQKQGTGSGGILLLVARPIGMAAQGYVRDARIFVCPGERAWWPFPTNANDFLEARANLPAMSYMYWYVPPGGDSYAWWDGAANKVPHWDKGAYAGFERHNVKQRRAASTTILSEVSAASVKGFQVPPYHGPGGNVLYLDGHAIWVARAELPEFDPSLTYGNLKSWMSALDHAAGAQ